MENAERLLCGSRRLQSGYLQSQDGDHTPLPRNLLGAAQQCCEPLQCKWISQLRQIDAYQRQIGDFAAVEEDILMVGGMLGPVYRAGQIAPGQPEMGPDTFDPGTKERDSSRLIHPLHLAYGLFGPGQIALSHTDTREHLIGYHENVHVLQGCRLLNGDLGSAFRHIKLIPCVRKLSLEYIGIRRHRKWSSQAVDQLLKFL